MSRPDDIAELQRLTGQLKTQVDDICKGASAEQIAATRQSFLPVKLQLIKFQLVPPFDNDGLTEQQRETVLTCARTTWESGVLFSVVTKDIDAFMRYAVQARAYYFELSQLVSNSEHSWVILGLNLMAMLAHNRISEFHTLLERIPQLKRQREFISFPVKLEQFLMEGAYNKILKVDDALPHPSYGWFMEMLVSSVRSKILDCAGKAYESLSLQQARDLFKLADDAQLVAVAEERGWKIQDGMLCFNCQQNQNLEIPSFELIERQLGYATALERIV